MLTSVSVCISVCVLGVFPYILFRTALLHTEHNARDKPAHSSHLFSTLPFFRAVCIFLYMQALSSHFWFNRAPRNHPVKWILYGYKQQWKINFLDTEISSTSSSPTEPFIEALRKRYYYPDSCLSHPPCL